MTYLNKAILVLLLGTVLLSSCEQERIEDTRALHPFERETPVIFGFLRSGATSIILEGSRTVPFYDQATTRPLNDLEGILYNASQALGRTVPTRDGEYVVILDEELRSGSGYSMEFIHPNFGSVYVREVIIPHAVNWLTAEVSPREPGFTLRGIHDIVPDSFSVSYKLLRFAEGEVINQNELDVLPVRNATQPLDDTFNSSEAYNISPEFIRFDPVTRVPTDTVMLDSVQLVVYTWGPEVHEFTTSLQETNSSFGDGSESIDGLTYSNLENAFGLIAGFATDTITYRLN